MIADSGLTDSEIEISHDGANIVIFDADGDVTAGAGATQVDATTVHVPRATVTGKLSVELGNGNDSVTIGALDLGLAELAVTDSVATVELMGAVIASGGISLEASESITVVASATLSTRQTAAGADLVVDASTGDSGAIEFSAPTITIGSAARLLAHTEPSSAHTAGDLTLLAVEIGGVAVSPVTIGKHTDTHITIDGATIKGGHLRMDATADSSNFFDESSTFLFQGGIEVALDFLSGLNAFGGAALSSATAEVLVNGGSDIDVVSANMNAVARSEAIVRTPGTGLAFSYGKSEPTAKVIVSPNVTINTAQNLTMNSLADSKMQVSAVTANLGPSRGANVDLTGAVTQSKIESTAELLASDTVTVGGDLEVRALSEKSQNTSALAGAYEDSTLR